MYFRVTMLLASALLLASQAQALVFPFRIKFLAVDKCESKRPISGSTFDPHIIEDGQCHSEDRAFNTFTMSKNNTPMGDDMTHFGICDMTFYDESDCEGTLVSDLPHVNVRDQYENNCIGATKMARSVKLQCRKR